MGHARRYIAIVTAVALGLSTSCTCRNDIGGVDLGFRVAGETQSLDFGRVLEGQSATQRFILTADSRVGVTVSMQVTAPFSVQRTVDIEGGGQVEVPVTFLAGNGAAMAEVVLTANDKELRVAVKGVGVRPLVCVPSMPCRTSTYSLEQDACVEAVVADDARCEPLSDCLEDGRCRSGECLGVARRCDDNDACTTDACAMGRGCVHPQMPCPVPADPCHVPTCNATSGCGEASAADLTPCGPVNCVSLSVCMSGDCVTVPTPEGILCGPPVACVGEGRCHNQQCERVDAGPWLPEWSAQIAGSPLGAKPSLLSSANGLFFEVCDLPSAAGVDAGRADAGSDAGWGDGGDGDGGDGGRLDAGAPDGGALDAGPPPPRVACGLSSYTRSGFERFTMPFDDGAARRLAHASSAAVVMLADGGIEWRSPTTGALVNFMPMVLPLESPRAVAGFANGAVLIAVPGLNGTRIVAWSDAGIFEVTDTPGVSVKTLAIDERNGLLGWDPVSGSLLLPGDGGVLRLDGGSRSLVTAGGVTLAGTSHLVHRLSDGGLEVTFLEWSSDAGEALVPEERNVLLGLGAGAVFYRRCESPVMSCLDIDKPLFMRTFDADTGAMRAEREVLPSGLDAQLEEAVLLERKGAVVTFLNGASAAADAGFSGPNAAIEIFVEGQQTVFCPLGERVSNLRGVVFSDGHLFVLDDRPVSSGGAQLKAYPLGALPLHLGGWSQPDGLGGTRRAGP